MSTCIWSSRAALYLATEIVFRRAFTKWPLRIIGTTGWTAASDAAATASEVVATSFSSHVDHCLKLWGWLIQNWISDSISRNQARTLSYWKSDSISRNQVGTIIYAASKYEADTKWLNFTESGEDSNLYCLKVWGWHKIERVTQSLWIRWVL